VLELRSGKVALKNASPAKLKVATSGIADEPTTQENTVKAETADFSKKRIGDSGPEPTGICINFRAQPETKIFANI
jgi:hypothetical protein